MTRRQRRAVRERVLRGIYQEGYAEDGAAAFKLAEESFSESQMADLLSQIRSISNLMEIGRMREEHR